MIGPDWSLLNSLYRISKPLETLNLHKKYTSCIYFIKIQKHTSSIYKNRLHHGSRTKVCRTEVQRSQCSNSSYIGVVLGLCLSVLCKNVQYGLYFGFPIDTQQVRFESSDPFQATNSAMASLSKLYLSIPRVESRLNSTTFRNKMMVLTGSSEPRKSIDLTIV